MSDLRRIETQGIRTLGAGRGRDEGRRRGGVRQEDRRALEEGAQGISTGCLPDQKAQVPRRDHLHPRQQRGDQCLRPQLPRRAGGGDPGRRRYVRFLHPRHGRLPPRADFHRGGPPRIQGIHPFGKHPQIPLDAEANRDPGRPHRPDHQPPLRQDRGPPLKKLLPAERPVQTGNPLQQRHRLTLF